MNKIEKAVEELDYVVTKWNVCQLCHVVDADMGRAEVGSKCSVCNSKSNGSVFYFTMSVYTLVDLIKEAFTTECKITRSGYKLNAHYIAVLLYFCALREVLMNGLVVELCTSNNIGKRIRDRLESDNKLYSQKQNKLFYSLTGVEWNNALKELEVEKDKPYKSLNNFLKCCADSRNSFLHKGYRIFERQGDGISDINESVASDCILNIEILINLYVDLHNKYVHPSYKKDNSTL